MPTFNAREIVPVEITDLSTFVRPDTLDHNRPIRLIVRTSRDHAEIVLGKLKEYGWKLVSGLGAEYYRPSECGGYCSSDVLCRGENPQRQSLFSDDVVV